MNPEYFEERLKEKFINQCPLPGVTTVAWTDEDWKRYWLFCRASRSMYNIVPERIDTEKTDWTLVVFAGSGVSTFRYIGKTITCHTPMLIYHNHSGSTSWINLYDAKIKRIVVEGHSRRIIVYAV